LDTEGDPLLATGAMMRAHIDVERGAVGATRFREHAISESTIFELCRSAFPVSLEVVWRATYRRYRPPERGILDSARWPKAVTIGKPDQARHAP
jgi:hypothetical protein